MGKIVESTPPPTFLVQEEGDSSTHENSLYKWKFPLQKETACPILKVFFLHLLFLKIIHMPKRPIWGWPVPGPFSNFQPPNVGGP